MGHTIPVSDDTAARLDDLACDGEDPGDVVDRLADEYADE